MAFWTKCHLSIIVPVLVWTRDRIAWRARAEQPPRSGTAVWGEVGHVAAGLKFHSDGLQSHSPHLSLSLSLSLTHTHTTSHAHTHTCMKNPLF